MGTPIVKLEGEYLIWSTSLDAPMTFGLTREELEAEVLEWDGRNALEALPRRLARADATGTSQHETESAEDVIWLNRAGPNETRLHPEEIIEFFVRRKKPPSSSSLAAFREGLPRCGPTCPAIPDEDGCAMKCDRCNGTDFVRPASPRQGDGGR